MLFVGFIIGLLGGLLIAAVAGRLLYQRLVLAREQARQSERLAELGTLTSGLAHEIRNPLSTVQLNLQLLQEDLVGDRSTSPRVLNRIGIVTREALRLRVILDDFLRYAGRLEIERQPIDLNELLTELVDFLSPQAQQTRIQLRHVPAATPIIANADPKLIKQSLLNLMLNAMQFMPGGGDLIVSAKRAGNEAIVTITDTGPGIAADEQSRVFDAYFSKRKGGTGLGLAMTQRIAHEHGGRIELSSELGKGSSFSIILPAAATSILEQRNETDRPSSPSR